MNYFNWEAVKKILYETPQRYPKWWRLTLCCEHNQVYKIEREEVKFIDSPHTTLRLADAEVDIQRILIDDFWGKIFVEGFNESVLGMTKREVLKP